MNNLLETPTHERAAEDIVKPLPIPKATELPKEAPLWRIIRISIALPLLAFSLAALLPFSVLPVSTQAVVNARLSEVRAPLAAQMGSVSLETGDVVNAGQLLVTGGPPISKLNKEEIANSNSRQQMLHEGSEVQAELAAGMQEKSRYDQQYSQYLQHVIGDLQMQIQEMQKSLATSQQRATSTAADLKHAQQVFKDHLIPKSMMDDAVTKADAAQTDLDAKSASLRVLQKQLADANAGYVMDPNKTPAFLTARDNATSSVELLQQKKSALDQQLNGKANLDGVALSPAGFKMNIVSPVSGTIWSRSVATGQTVEEGDELFQVADANSIHVEVWLDRRYGPQLSIGDTAYIYLSGLGKELHGRVTSFGGTSRRNMEEEINAIGLQPVHPDQYHVSIELDPEDRQALYIGQAAKVLFPGSKHRIRARIYFWLTRL